MICCIPSQYILQHFAHYRIVNYNVVCPSVPKITCQVCLRKDAAKPVHGKTSRWWPELIHLGRDGYGCVYHVAWSKRMCNLTTKIKYMTLSLYKYLYMTVCICFHIYIYIYIHIVKLYSCIYDEVAYLSCHLKGGGWWRHNLIHLGRGGHGCVYPKSKIVFNLGAQIQGMCLSLSGSLYMNIYIYIYM